MTPGELSARSFAGYPAEGTAFAVTHLELLRRLPLCICPSFLRQIQQLDTLFPAERELLTWQCACLQQMTPTQFTSLAAPLRSLTLSPALETMDWVRAPQVFITDLAAYLWSSGQIDNFRQGTEVLFAAVPAREDRSKRLVVVVLGQGAQVDAAKVLRKLRKHGVLLTSVQHESAFADIAQLCRTQDQGSAVAYSRWYVDGGSRHPELTAAAGEQSISISYADLKPVRQHVLERMRASLSGGVSDAEQMRARLSGTTVREAGTQDVTTDPVLSRFYTELFTDSSGPQIFSTSFVQWTGRELARRARPELVILRYTPRQSHRDMNAMFGESATDVPQVDPQGSLVDAEEGAYYTWMEMSRITAPGKLSFIAWIEGQPTAVILGPAAPAGVVSSTPMSLVQALQNFG